MTIRSERLAASAELARLREENMRLRDRLLAVCAACAECGGTGVITERRDGRGHLVSQVACDSGRILTEHQVPCPECSDLREALE